LNEEEARELLRALRINLAEFGSTAISSAHDAFPEDGDVSVYRELARVIDEYAAILVDTPEMMKTTMGLLQARSISFASDPSDIRFENTGDGIFAANRPSITLALEDLDEWLGIANEAREIISELKRRLNDNSQ